MVCPDLQRSAASRCHPVIAEGHDGSGSAVTVPPDQLTVDERVLRFDLGTSSPLHHVIRTRLLDPCLVRLVVAVRRLREGDVTSLLSLGLTRRDGGVDVSRTVKMV